MSLRVVVMKTSVLSENSKYINQMNTAPTLPFPSSSAFASGDEGARKTFKDVPVYKGTVQSSSCFKYVCYGYLDWHLLFYIVIGGGINSFKPTFSSFSGNNRASMSSGLYPHTYLLCLLLNICSYYIQLIYSRPSYLVCISVVSSA